MVIKWAPFTIARVRFFTTAVREPYRLYKCTFKTCLSSGGVFALTCAMWTVFIRGGIQNIPDWCRHLYSSRGSTKNLSQQAKLLIPGSTATCCGDCVKTCEDVASNFGENRPGCFTMTTPRLTLPSSPSSFWRDKKRLLSPHPPYSPDLAPCDFFLF
jgi:hypothetical protein